MKEIGDNVEYIIVLTTTILRVALMVTVLRAHTYTNSAGIVGLAGLLYTYVYFLPFLTSRYYVQRLPKTHVRHPKKK